MTQLHPIAKLEKLLLSTDGSEFSERGCKRGVKLAKIGSSKLFRIVRHRNKSGNLRCLHRKSSKKEEEQTRDRLEQVKSKAAKEGVECEIIARHTEVTFSGDNRGGPKKQADMIIMGRRGRTGSGDFSWGAFTAKVIGYSPCNVLVVPRLAEIRYEKILVATDGSKYKRCGCFGGYRVSQNAAGAELFIIFP